MKSDMRCPHRFARRHVWPYIYGSEAPETPEPLARGILVHTALATHNARLMAAQNGWDHARFYTGPEALAVAARQHSADAGFAKALPKCGKAVEVYCDTYTPASTTWELIAIEQVREVWFDGDGNMVDPPADAETRRQLAAERPVRPFADPPYLHTFRRDLRLVARRSEGEAMNADDVRKLLLEWNAGRSSSS